MKKSLFLVVYTLCLFSCKNVPSSTNELILRNLDVTSPNGDWNTIRNWAATYEVTTLINNQQTIVIKELQETLLPGLQKLTSYINDTVHNVDLTNSESKRFIYRYEKGKPVAVDEIETGKPVPLKEELIMLKNSKEWVFQIRKWNNGTFYSLKSNITAIEHLYDQETFLRVMTISGTSYGESIMSYSNYKDIDGFLIPFNHTTEVKASKYKQAKTLKDISLNVNLENSDFQIDDDWKLIAEGNDVPKFEVLSLVKPKVRLTGESFENKVLLIDFWATWCKPCIKEFPHLKSLYSNYKDKDFEILGISLDENPKSLMRFLASRDLPWIIANDSLGFKSKIAKTFEVASLPKTILIDRDGKIIAIGKSATGNSLLDHLKKVL